MTRKNSIAVTCLRYKLIILDFFHLSLNYLIGAWSSAAVLGAWKKNFMAGIYLGVAFSIAGALKKLSIKEGWEFFPEVEYKHGYGSLKGASHDFTIFKDPLKGWTK